jgi:hypothetical protein
VNLGEIKAIHPAGEVPDRSAFGLCALRAPDRKVDQVGGFVLDPALPAGQVSPLDPREEASEIGEEVGRRPRRQFADPVQAIEASARARGCRRRGVGPLMFMFMFMPFTKGMFMFMFMFCRIRTR